MNITQTFRRKNKFHKPIIVFKQLYRDYYKQSSPSSLAFTTLLKNQLKQKLSQQELNPCNKICRQQIKNKLQKTRSAQQLTKYIQVHGSLGETYSRSINKSILNKSSSSNKRSISSLNSSYVFRLLQRQQLQELEKDKQSYFKNYYTSNHPLFQKDQLKFRQRQISTNQEQKLQILPDIFKAENTKLKRPIDRRIQVQQLKNKFTERKQNAMQKYSKVRYNFLIKNKFENHAQTMPVRHHVSRAQILNETKQNIFPGSTLQ